MMRKVLTGLLMTTCAAPLLAAPAQPELGTRAKKTITVKGNVIKHSPFAGSIEVTEILK